MKHWATVNYWNVIFTVLLTTMVAQHFVVMERVRQIELKLSAVIQKIHGIENE